MRLPFGTDDYHRTYGRLPRIRSVNGFWEQDPTSEQKMTWLQRPGLSPFVDLGEGEVEVVWRQDGTFNGDYLVSAGGRLYRVSSAGAVTSLGIIGTGTPSIAATQDRAIIVNNGIAFSTDGVDVSTVEIPDNSPAGSVVTINGFFIITVQDSQRFYWIFPGEEAPDPLDFASAERQPDNIIAVKVVNDTIWFLGSSGEEVWVTTGNSDAPFQRQSSLVYENGCLSGATAIVLDGVLYWVSNAFEVVQAAGRPQRISNPAIVEHLRTADPASFRAWAYRLDQHAFYVLTCDIGTFVYDASTQLWSRFHSYQRDFWRASAGAQSEGQIVAGDAESGKLWMLDANSYNDAGQEIVREVTMGIENLSVPIRCNSVSLRMAAGWSPQYRYTPLVEVCFSDDDGNTWSQWRRYPLGDKGVYHKDLVMRSWGLVRRPGKLFWIRMTDNAQFRINGAAMNEA